MAAPPVCDPRQAPSPFPAWVLHISPVELLLSSSPYVGFEENKVSLTRKEYIYMELLRLFFPKQSERVLVVSDPVLKCHLGARVVCLPYRKLGVKNIIHCFSIKLFSEFVLLSLPWEKQESPGSQAGAGGAPGKAGWSSGGWGMSRGWGSESHICPLPLGSPGGPGGPGRLAASPPTTQESSGELQERAPSEPGKPSLSARGGGPGGRSDSGNFCAAHGLSQTGPDASTPSHPGRVSRLWERASSRVSCAHAQLPGAPQVGMVSSSPLPTLWWEEDLWGLRERELTPLGSHQGPSSLDAQPSMQTLKG